MLTTDIQASTVLCITMCNNSTSQLLTLAHFSSIQGGPKKRKLCNIRAHHQHAEQSSSHHTIRFRFDPDTLADIRSRPVPAGFPIKVNTVYP